MVSYGLHPTAGLFVFTLFLLSSSWRERDQVWLSRETVCPNAILVLFSSDKMLFLVDCIHCS